MKGVRRKFELIFTSRFLLPVVIIWALFALLLLPLWDIFEDFALKIDVLPDIGARQQIVEVQWHGQSPELLHEHVVVPLSAELGSLSGVCAVRTRSGFGKATLYIIFEAGGLDGDDFWDWTRQKLLEKMASLPHDFLPKGASMKIGPDADALGQIFWFTLESRDVDSGEITSAWTLAELREHLEYYVKPRLSSIAGVAEIALIGGREIELGVRLRQEDLRRYGVSPLEVESAIREANEDKGLGITQWQGVEYFAQSLGKVRDLKDLRKLEVARRDGVPVYLADVAEVLLQAAPRRSALDKNGSEAVGAVAVLRRGAKPLEVVEELRREIDRINTGAEIRKEGTLRSSVRIEPFYDRARVARRSLAMLLRTNWRQFLATLALALIMLRRLHSALALGLSLPLTVLLTLPILWIFGLDLNILALLGIVIAIGSIADMAVVILDDFSRRRESNDSATDLTLMRESQRELYAPVLTASFTTLASFLPLFFLGGESALLFKPLVFTKTAILLCATFVSIIVAPRLMLFFGKFSAKFFGKFSAKPRSKTRRRVDIILFVVAICLLLLASGADKLVYSWRTFTSDFWPTLLIFILMILVLALCLVFYKYYGQILRFFMLGRRSIIFLFCVCGFCVCGFFAWQSLDYEFLPEVDEGSFLYMPTLPAHASFDEARRVLREQNSRIADIEGVSVVVGKIGGVESALDPAPLSMIETIVQYDSFFGVGGEDLGKSSGKIWAEIREAASMLGVTDAPLLHPIGARIVMLESGLRSRLGLKVFADDLANLALAMAEIERLLRAMPEIDLAKLSVENIFDKIYLNVDFDDELLAARGISPRAARDTLEMALGGRVIGEAFFGRARRDLRLAYAQDFGEEPEVLADLALPLRKKSRVARSELLSRDLSGESAMEVFDQTSEAGRTGDELLTRFAPLGELAKIRRRAGANVINGEDSMYVGHISFDGNGSMSRARLAELLIERLGFAGEAGELDLPTGTFWEIAGVFAEEDRGRQRVQILALASFGLIYFLLYRLFRSHYRAFCVLLGALVAFSGAFIGIFLWEEFRQLAMEVSILRGIAEVLVFEKYNLNLAVWVGMLCLFGIAVDDGVIMTHRIWRENYDGKSFEADIDKFVNAAKSRNRAAMTTSSLTLIALLPAIFNQDLCSALMRSVSLPIFAGMIFAIMNTLLTPLMLSFELKLNKKVK